MAQWERSCHQVPSGVDVILGPLFCSGGKIRQSRQSVYGALLSPHQPCVKRGPFLGFVDGLKVRRTMKPTQFRSLRYWRRRVTGRAPGGRVLK